MRSLSAVLLPLALPLAVYSVILKPTGYHLQIDASTLATSNTFNGNVSINLTLTDTEADTRDILLNAKQLDVSSVVVLKQSIYRPDNWGPVDVSKIDNNGSILQIIFSQPQSTGSYRLNITFKGQYRNNMTGFAKVGYSYNKTQKFMGITRFEPTYASSVFPCFDEPSPRVNFILDITVSNQTVVSSVENKIVNNMDMTKTYRFDNYPKMAVYQLGWMIMDENDLEVFKDNTFSTSVFTRALYPYSNYTSWATNLTAHLMEATKSYTQIPYPLDKLEQLVVPEFFVGSAQSWGIISYSEEAFLVEASTPVTSTREQHQVALGLAQQVVQQWFGDYLTMDSWNNSWLMKGMTEHLKFTIASSVQNLSSWELTDHEVVELIQPALSMDIGVGEITPLSALDIYRGGALIRMVHNFIGNDLFQMAINIYFKEKKDSDTNTPIELWSLLNAGATESGVDLGAQSLQTIMKSWSDTAGYPVLNVTSNGTHFNISQPDTGRFVPVTYLLQGSSSKVSKVWLQPGSNLFIPTGGSSWILLNINQTGYYRVNYSKSILTQLKNDYPQLPRLSRSQLIDDLFSLALSGDYSMIQLLEFLSVLSNESDYFPWYSALKNMQTLLDKLYGHTSYDLIQKFTLDSMNAVINNIGMEKSAQDSHTDSLKRIMVLEKACAYGHSDCLKTAVSILKRWMAKQYFYADLNMGLLCSAVSNNSDATWWELLSMRISQVPSVRPVILKALTCSRNKQLLNEFLTNITSTTNPSLISKEKNVVLQTLASTPFGADVLFNWLVNKLNFQFSDKTTTTVTPESSTASPKTVQTGKNVSSDSDISVSGRSIDTYEATPTTSESLAEEDIALILSLIQGKLTTLSQGTKLEEFVQSKNVSGLSNSILQLIDKVTGETYKQDQWARQYNTEIKSWLEAKTSTTPGVTSKPPATPSSDSTTTAKPTSSASTTVYTSLTLTVLAVVSQYLIPSLRDVSL